MNARQALGQYFTPRPVIDFALDALVRFGAQIAGARVLDPACGPGEWLAAALVRGAGAVTGLDCDPALAAAWQPRGLGADPRCRLQVRNGLAPGTVEDAGFDLVIGNPPFGAQLPDTGPEALRALARTYRLPRRGPERLVYEPSAADLRRIARFPVELLFLERFVSACRAGGSIAIILPEGVLANSRWRRVRAWLLAEVAVDAVVGLPRAAFRRHATTARTCLVLARRTPPSPRHRVLLAEADDCSPDALRELLAALARGASLADGPPDGLLPPPLLRP